MTLIGFRARNHPQQQGTLFGVNDEVDDRAITVTDFAPLHARFGFTIDAAAAEHNARLPRYWTRADDALAQPWAGERVWCNPPYSHLAPWIAKAWAETEHCPVIVMLLPANRTEQRWWQDGVEPRRDRGGVPVVDRVPAGADEVPASRSDRDRPQRTSAVRVPAGDLESR